MDTAEAQLLGTVVFFSFKSYCQLLRAVRGSARGSSPTGLLSNKRQMIHEATQNSTDV